MVLAEIVLCGAAPVPEVALDESMPSSEAMLVDAASAAVFSESAPAGPSAEGPAPGRSAVEMNRSAQPASGFDREGESVDGVSCPVKSAIEYANWCAAES
jgi:hypothetical protein